MKLIDLVNTLAYGKEMTKKSTITKKHWITAGFKALSTGGYSAIKIEAIARTINISKGSFYWHFKNALELKMAMLDYWYEKATGSIIEEINSNSQDPAERLRLLITISTRQGSGQLLNSRFDEAAIRHWARFDIQVAKTMKKVDKARLTFVENLFVKIERDKQSAHLKASILYASLIGLEHLCYHNLANLKNDLPKLLEMLIIEPKFRR